ncbi:phosphate/phosphite/phosphonate ABC transporter substrate-binding protein [Roseobacter sp. YSTF-M11]|uniref:Phosphate/phosphite/phosphonate ABC transporter substrate-binding protein n=1 Tax=Roseobacter insulae TaxID=2859783 RepID=A0A9X1K459_9RHOB|nr:PhnD/SsuA/transferrin family substrate-binding protein [Roseobacter insulae]MBW4710263.1 phosphate/phosphite/phosphonate ABC transporter substrate-binding protein [Roseobacter insulae]
MTASLPMYDTTTTRAANDRLWRLIRQQLRHGPVDLDRQSDPHDTWNDPGLVLSQTCGLPYRSVLHDSVALVGTPDYRVRGCPQGYYKSYVVVRKDDPRRDIGDFREAVLARNDVRSQSGWAAIEGYLAENDVGFSFVGHTLDTGSHLRAAEAVAAGRADIAALDAVTWTLIKRESAVAGQLRVLLSTRPTPGLPFITSAGNDVDRLFDAIASAIPALSGRDRGRLLLKGIVRIPKEAYLAEPLPPE